MARLTHIVAVVASPGAATDSAPSRRVVGTLFNALALCVRRFMLVGASIAFFLAGASLATAQPRAPELEPNLGWLNTAKPLRFSDELKGHVVVLDFWTYCCINCIHVLPDLAALEEKYKSEPVVIIGVHSAKFENEGLPESVRNAIFRYRIRHPVVIDRGYAIWKRYDIHGWPSFAVIGTDGKLVDLNRPGGGKPAYTRSGEGNRLILDVAIKRALQQGRASGTLAAKRVDIQLDASAPSASGLAFPGKVLAIAPAGTSPGRVFIADSSHNRIVIATFSADDPSRCKLSTIIGATAFDADERTLVDGAADRARLNDPQGMAYDGDKQLLYVADTKNHAIRVVHLGDAAAVKVTTLVGTGEQSRDRAGGAAGAAQGLNSPWDLVLTPDGNTLYVAMAGSHQLWKVDTATGAALAIAGGDREDILDGPAKRAYLAQPSGLALLSGAGKEGGVAAPLRLYFADSEVSAVRYFDFADDAVRTIIGSGLFDFGDVDGAFPDAMLQHCLGVSIFPKPDAKGPLDHSLLVADTYNHKIKLVDPGEKTSQEWIGREREVNIDDAALALDEPGGLCFASSEDGKWKRLFIADTNNHRVIVVDPADKSWKELVIDGLAAPASADDAGTKPEKIEKAVVTAAPGKSLTLSLRVKLPGEGRLNVEAPAGVRVTLVQADGAAGSSNATAALVAQRTVRSDKWPILIEIPAERVTAGTVLRVDFSFGWCTKENTGVCMPGMVHWDVTIERGDESKAELSQGI
ncbi:MAG: redoxin family protein [Pyrinomonadaceae bacterium]|nr:redoxin family protein [Phycisphaerales bacterium]